jgi:hypothetical protein
MQTLSYPTFRVEIDNTLLSNSVIGAGRIKLQYSNNTKSSSQVLVLLEKLSSPTALNTAAIAASTALDTQNSYNHYQGYINPDIASTSNIRLYIEQDLPHMPKTLIGYIQEYLHNLLSKILLLDPFYMHAQVTCRIFLLEGSLLYLTLAAAINALCIAFLHAGIPLKTAFFAFLNTDSNHNHDTLLVLSGSKDPETKVNARVLAMEGKVLADSQVSNIIHQQLHCGLLPLVKQALLHRHKDSNTS